MANTTRHLILSTAEGLLRTKGFKSFTYADVAEEIGISRAAIHHHFPTKEELVIVLVKDTMEAMQAAMSDHHDQSALGQLDLYIGFFRASLRADFVCLCGMLIAEEAGLPDKVRLENLLFANWQLNWLKEQLERGQQRSEFKMLMPPKDAAEYIYSSVQGSHMIAKSHRNQHLFDNVIRNSFQLVYKVT